MKNAILFLLCLIPCLAQAGECKLYAKGEFGGSSSRRLGAPNYRESPNNSLIAGIGIGKEYSKLLNFELMGYFNQYSINETERNTTYTQRITTKALFINTIFHLNSDVGFIPFVTLGFGFSSNTAGTYRAQGEIKGIRPSDNKIEPVYNVGFGIKKKIKHQPNVEISLGYKYFHLGRATTSPIGISGGLGAISTPVVAKLNNHAILVGLSYHF